MDKQDRNVQFAKHLKVMEWLKSEILEQVSGLFKGLLHGNEALILDSMASLLLAIYVLARRVGIPFHKLETAVKDKIQEHLKHGHEVEEWYGDLSLLEQYINKR
ncbi:MazG-like family protein [Tepidibacillus fermentans]|uniref:MazG-like nucleotide pyrophosphohydrolase family protein n=1 Tax=Tepidibacillus fermentans TaxID=1281767 RepID=A0A4R3KCJ3_9BACI|nr:MazG-like family protein [Tepidibacillus fermentans]TCS80795.1 MazG-like nucleotide pyrophosphohydrolase family protein [Tepidibacillus fermentans]